MDFLIIRTLGYDGAVTSGNFRSPLDSVPTSNVQQVVVACISIQDLIFNDRSLDREDEDTPFRCVQYPFVSLAMYGDCRAHF